MNTPLRIVCWFSCGVASAVATKLAISANKQNIPLVVARCIVREEHPDNDRFAADCEKWFGVPIVNLMNEKFDGSIYKVFERGYISGINGAPCTGYLKKDVRKRFELVTDRHVFGYTTEERARFDRFLDANNIDVDAPLITQSLSHQDCVALVASVGIEIPTMYKLGYKHNNCMGCCKATGAGYWNKIRVDFPEMFDKMSIISRKLKVRIVQYQGERIFLDELASNVGDYKLEPEAQCGITCEMVKGELE